MYSKEHEKTAFTLANVGCAHLAQDKLDLALRQLEEALRVQVQTLGREDTQTAGTIVWIACVHEKQGKLKEALSGWASRGGYWGTSIPSPSSGYEEALGIQRRILGDEHPIPISTLANIAYMHNNQGRHSKALKGFKEALRIRRKMLGEEHPDVVASLAQIAVVHADQGKHMLSLVGTRKCSRA